MAGSHPGESLDAMRRTLTLVPASIRPPDEGDGVWVVAGALGGRPGPGLSRASHGGPALPEDVVRNDETRLEEEHG